MARDAQKAAADRGSSGGTEFVVLLVLAIVTFIVRGAWFGDPNADIDEQLYSLIGFGMTQGALPYVDLWDRKPIGLFALFALAHAVGGPGPIAYQVLAALFTLGGAYMTYRLALTLADRVTSLAAGLLYIFLMSIYGALSANSEAFWVPMMVGMALLVRDQNHPNAVPRALAAMLLGGIALQVKYTALPQCLFFGMWALWGQHRAGRSLVEILRLAFAFGVLGVLPTALVGAAYALGGYWDDFIFANFSSFFQRLPSSFGRWRSDSPLYLAPAIALFICSTYAAARLAPPADRRVYGFFALWLVATLASIHLPSTVYLYYYAAFAPALALYTLPLIDRRSPVGLVPTIMVLAGFAYLLFLPAQYAEAEKHRDRMHALASAIAPYVNLENRCLYIFDGPAALYRLSGSCLPTRFIYPDHLNNAFERNSLGVSQVAEVARILSKRPPVIVTADTAFTPQNEEAKALVWTTVRRDYKEVAMEELHERKIRVWMRRDATAR